jgi:hypothetical protein
MTCIQKTVKYISKYIVYTKKIWENNEHFCKCWAILGSALIITNNVMRTDTFLCHDDWIVRNVIVDRSIMSRNN